MTTSSETFKVEILESHERGNSERGWLHSHHSFPFPGMKFGKYENWGPLRILNEDRVEAHQGFGQHSHREFEIFSYVVSGQLEHKDSMHNTEILKRGDVQLTSAGTGISHSEHSYGDEPVHFLQIWCLPSAESLTPKYYTRSFSDEEKVDKLCKIVAPANASGVFDLRNETGPTPIHAPVTAFATLLSPNATIIHTFDKTSTKGFVQVVQTSGYRTGKVTEGTVVMVNETHELHEGDAGFLTVNSANAVLTFHNASSTTAEVLLFELGST